MDTPDVLEQIADEGIALAGLAFSSRFRVAWTQRRPRGKPVSRAKAGEVGTSFDEKHRCRHGVEAGDSLQQFPGPGIGLHGFDEITIQDGGLLYPGQRIKCCHDQLGSFH
jgi:hypothetical protein